MDKNKFVKIESPFEYHLNEIQFMKYVRDNIILPSEYREFDYLKYDILKMAHLSNTDLSSAGTLLTYFAPRYSYEEITNKIREEQKYYSRFLSDLSEKYPEILNHDKFYIYAGKFQLLVNYLEKFLRAYKQPKYSHAQLIQILTYIKFILEKETEILILHDKYFDKLQKINSGLKSFTCGLSEIQINNLYDILVDDSTDKTHFKNLFRGVEIRKLKGKIKWKAANRLVNYFFRQLIEKKYLSEGTNYQDILDTLRTKSKNDKFLNNSDFANAKNNTGHCEKNHRYSEKIDKILKKAL